MSLARDNVFVRNLIVTMHNLFWGLFRKITLIVTMHNLFLVLSRKITWNKLLKAIVTLMLFVAVVNFIIRYLENVFLSANPLSKYLCFYTVKLDRVRFGWCSSCISTLMNRKLFVLISS